MDKILFDIPLVFIYLDDMLIASKSREEHEYHLREVLHCLQANGLVLNVAKCVWGLSEIELLGHKILAEGVAPLANRVAAVQRFPRPVNTQQLHAFLGLFNFYRRFVPAAAAIVRPLTDALKGSPASKKPIQWSQQRPICQGRLCWSTRPPGPKFHW
jgi:hypothetical protein